MKPRLSCIALLAALVGVPAAAASAPDDGAHRQYYNRHLRLVQGVRSGQLLAGEDGAMVDAGAAGIPGIPPGGLQSASMRARDGGPAQGHGRWRTGDEKGMRQEAGAGSHE